MSRVGRTSFVLALLVVASALAPVTHSARAAYPATSNGKIAYIRNDVLPGSLGKPCLGDALWWMNASGSGQAALTSASPDHAMGDPAWSPDGRYLAYTWVHRDDVQDDGDLDALVIGLFDSLSNQHMPNLAVLPMADFPSVDAAAFCEQPYGPTWSPDGEKVAIQNYYGLAVLDFPVDNTPTYLDGAGGYTDVNWAPFGTRFAVGSVVNNPNFLTVGTLNMAGGNEKKLTFNDITGADDGDRYYPFPLSRPDWAPDGTSVLVNSRHGGGNHDRPRMGILDRCGGNLKLLEPNPRSLNRHFGYEGSWSPNGEKIVFSDGAFIDDAAFPNGSRQEADIWAMDVDGTGLTNLTSTESTLGASPIEYAPDWQPVSPQPATDPPSCPGEGGVVEGRVFDGIDRVDGHANPLTDVTVSLLEEGDVPEDTVKSGPDGSFLFEQVPPGTYRVRATLEYSDDAAAIFDVRHGQLAFEPVWIEREVVVEADGAPPPKNLIFSSDPGARLSDVTLTIPKESRNRLDDIANIFFRTWQYATWANDTLGSGVASASPATVKMHAYSQKAPGAGYFPLVTEIHMSDKNSSFESRKDRNGFNPENTEWHEFTHHLLYSNVGDWTCPGEDNHGGWPNKSTCDSLNEGAASFFPTVADRTIRSDPTDSLYSVFGSMEHNSKAWSKVVSRTKTGVGSYYREDLAVTTLLWDLYDSEADSDDDFVVKKDASGAVPVTYTDAVSLPVETLWDAIASLSASPTRTVRDLWLALQTNADVPAALTAITVDLNQDGESDVAPLDVVFLMHDFHPVIHHSGGTFFIYDPDIADDRGFPGENRNRAIGRTDRPEIRTGSPVYVVRKSMDLVPGAQLKIDVRDQKDFFVADTTAKLKIVYPETTETIAVPLRDGKADSVYVELPPTGEFSFPETNTPDCDPSAEDTIKVVVSVSKSGTQSEQKETFNSCGYAKALIDRDRASAYDFDFTIRRDRSTTISLKVSKSGGKVSAAGEVKPAHDGKKVEVSLLRKRSGRFVEQADKKVTLNANSKYSASFARLSTGDCRIDVRFVGDEDHDSSKKSARFTC